MKLFKSFYILYLSYLIFMLVIHVQFTITPYLQNLYASNHCVAYFTTHSYCDLEKCNKQDWNNYEKHNKIVKKLTIGLWPILKIIKFMEPK